MTRTPHALLDHLREAYALNSDYRLSKFLGVQAPVLSKIRAAAANGGVYRGEKYSVSADMMLTIYDKTDMSIEQIRELAAA